MRITGIDFDGGRMYYAAMPTSQLAARFLYDVDPNKWILPIWGVLILAILGVAAWRESVRKKNLAKAAAALGFLQELPASVPKVQADLLTQRRAEVQLAFVGSVASLECHLFDFAYGAGKGRRTQTVALYRKEGVNVPKFELTERSWWKNILAMFREPVKLDSGSPSFNLRYVVSSKAPEEASWLFTPELQAYFEQLPSSAYTIEGSRDSVLVYRDQYSISGEQLAAFIDEGAKIAEGFFQHCISYPQVS